MATFKLTYKRGTGMVLKNIVKSAGSSEAQSDTMSLNVDVTSMSKGDVILGLEALIAQILASKFPQ